MEETGMNYLWSARKRNALGLPWTFTKYAFTEDRLFVTTGLLKTCLLYTSPSPRDPKTSRMPSSA